MTIVGVGDVGQAIAVRLFTAQPPISGMTVVATDALTERVRAIVAALRMPLLITVLTNTHLTVGPLYAPTAACFACEEAKPQVSKAPIGLLNAHFDLAAETTRFYLRESCRDRLIARLFDCALHRRAPTPCAHRKASAHLSRPHREA